MVAAGFLRADDVLLQTCTLGANWSVCSAGRSQRASSLSSIEGRDVTTENLAAGQRRRRLTVLTLLLVWLACAAYEGGMLKRGWVPHDDGAFGLTAERVLQGQMPHRDFDELYTGGLTYLNSAAFRLWGINFGSMRWMLFLFFLAWVPAVFYIATRLVRPLTAAAVTCLAVAASVPVYSSPVPSWYNLFFATFGTAAILRFLEARARSWMVVAGLCTGFSFLAKISGLYFLAAILLFLIFLEQVDSQSSSRRRTITGYTVFLTAGLLAFVLLLFKTVSTVNPAYVAHFILPGVSVAANLLWSEFYYAHEPSGLRFRRFFLLALPLVAGFLIPVIVFLVPYWRAGALHSFLFGVFVLPTRRFSFAALHPTHLRAMNLIATAALVGILYAAGRRRPWARWQNVTLALALLALLIASRSVHAIYSFVWSSMILLVPVTTVIAIVWMAYAINAKLRQRQHLFLLISVVALTSLIQFPFAAPIYFCYVTPLVLLAVSALVAVRPSCNRFAFAAILVFYLAFWIFCATPGFIYNLGLRYAANRQTATLVLPRAGGLRVDPQLAEEYARLIPLIQQHATGDYIYAAPDCPEVYFLSGKRNPTRSLFDFFDQDSTNRNQRILGTLDKNHVNVVTILTETYFSPPMNSGLLRELSVRYPNAEVVGSFQVRWRQ